MNETNLLLSVESINGQQNNFSYHATFKSDESNMMDLIFHVKENTQAISLPYEVNDIKLVRFYSNSTSTNKFFVISIDFYPIYMDNNEAKLHEKQFYSVFSSEPHNDKMTHNTWYTLDKDI